MSKGKTSPTFAPPLHANKRLLIDVDNVSVRPQEEHILDAVSLCVHAGEFVGLIGPNGAGKTTLLKAILGILAPKPSGRIAATWHRAGYVPQRGQLYNGLVPMSVLEVVSLGLGRSQAKTDALRALESVGMAPQASMRFTELSGGQQQRVAIAKALAGNADILMLDEPMTGVDERAQAEFYAILRSLQQRGITILMVSHDVDTVLSLVTRVICLNRTILYDGSPEHFDIDTYMPKLYKEQHLRLHHHHEGSKHA